jgi:CRISPR-associated protein (Cas_Cmr3)
VPVSGPAEEASWLALVPRDTVAVRDGRAFDAGADRIATASAPRPSTAAGAVGAVFSKAFGKEPGQVRGPVVGVADGLGGWQLRFPTPADLVRAEDGSIARLRPAAPPAGVSTDLLGPGGVPQLLAGAGTPAQGWVDDALLSAYLAAQEPFAPGSWSTPDDLVARLVEPPWTPERRLGLARTLHRTATSGFLYQAEHLRARDGVALLVQVVDPPGPAPAAGTAVQFGGERRLVDVAATDGVEFPPPPTSFPDGRVVVYLATPAFFPGGWRWCPDGAELIAAAVGGPEAVATASPKDGLWGTRVLRWAVPAGSVYYVRFGGSDGARSAMEWAQRSHGRCLPGQVTDEQGQDRLRTAGFGLALVGRW